MVEEGIMTAEFKPNFLGEGGTHGIVRGWGEGEEEGHLAHRKDDAPAIEEGFLVADYVAKNPI